MSNDIKAMSADDIRILMVKTFEEAKLTLQGYYDYAEKAMALSREYHAKRIKEIFGIEIEDLTCIMECDDRQTPVTLDKALAKLNGLKPKRIIHDIKNSKYYIYV
jgi:hypothetical protein